MKKIKILVTLAIVCVAAFGFQKDQQPEEIPSKNLEVEVSKQEVVDNLSVNVVVHFNSQLSYLERQAIRADFQAALGVNFISWSSCSLGSNKEVWALNTSVSGLYQIAVTLGYGGDIITTGEGKDVKNNEPSGGMDFAMYYNSNCSDF